MKLTYLLLIILLASCGHDEKIDLKPVLVSKEWEQEIGTIDGNYYALKQVYKLSFKADNSVDIVVDYLGVSGDPDPVVLKSYKTKYNFNSSDNTISFPEPIDTLYFSSVGKSVVRLPKIKIAELRSDKLITESTESNLDTWFLRGKVYFRPIK
jgi:hypothetical protein